MEMWTEKGTFDTAKLPDAYESCFCSRCGCRIGWKHEKVKVFIGLCDSCATVISKDNSEDPMGDTSK